MIDITKDGDVKCESCGGLFYIQQDMRIMFTSIDGGVNEYLSVRCTNCGQEYRRPIPPAIILDN